MTEYNRALRDIRADIIMEVAESIPGASAAETVKAIVARLDQGLPRLVEVDIKTAPGGEL